MTRLYRAISLQEKGDYDDYQTFRTGRNTLEAKQFFKSRIAIKEFVTNSVLQDYDPPYVFLMVITLDRECFNASKHTEIQLDGYDAINIEEDNLPEFNNCVKFVKQELL